MLMAKNHPNEWQAADSIEAVDNIRIRIGLYNAE